jgi:hypothetical protein
VISLDKGQEKILSQLPLSNLRLGGASSLGGVSRTRNS